MRAALVVLVLSGCIEPWFDSDDDGGPADIDPLPPPVLPDGVWEPLPGAHIVDASFVLDGSTVWWSTSRRISDPAQYIHETAVWVYSTSLDGTAISEPVKLSPADERASWSPDIVATPTAIVATGRSNGVVMRPFDRSGNPIGPVVPIPISDGPTQYEAPDTALLATASGTVQLVGSLRYESSEVALVELDTYGTVLSTTFGGSRDIVEPGGSSADGIAAATVGDTTLVAWQRSYYACVTDRPALSLTTSIANGVVAPLAQVKDEAASEMTPTIAAHGTGAFVAWLAWSADPPRLQLARYPDITTVLADFEGPNSAYPYGQYKLALGSADRGAIASRTATHLKVTPFEYRDGAIWLGEPTLQPLVDGEGAATLVGLEHVVDDQYVLAWREPEAIGAERERLFATKLALVPNTMRPAPPPLPIASATTTRGSEATRNPGASNPRGIGAPRPSRLRCP